MTTQKRWKIPDKQLETYSVERVERRLRSFNQLLNGQFYMVDYFRKKIIVSSPYAPILCGHPKVLIEEEGFDFFSRILKKEKLEWIKQLNEAVSKFWFQVPIEKRKKHVVFYDSTVEMRDNKNLILHHKVTPYKLCRNGNVWLELCLATVSTAKLMEHKANILNSETGKRYDFINGHFVVSSEKPITPEEVQILRWMVQGLPDKHMCSLLNNEIENRRGVSRNTFNARKRYLFKKLGVTNSAGAIHKAHLLGLI